MNQRHLAEQIADWLTDPEGPLGRCLAPSGMGCAGHIEANIDTVADQIEKIIEATQSEPPQGSRLNRCHSGHESPAALWNCPVCTDHKVEFYNRLEVAGLLGAAEALLGSSPNQGLLSTLRIDPLTVEGSGD